MSRRPHTGRLRNEAARRAVLDATLRLLREGGTDALTIEAIAREAEVGRQTIYRWWPSRAAIVHEAASERARASVPDDPDTGSLEADLSAFLRASYEDASSPEMAPVLRAMAADAFRDTRAADSFEAFTAERRAVLRAILERHGIGADRAGLLVDLAYGLLWYRLIVGHAPLDRRAADATADVLANAIAARGADRP